MKARMPERPGRSRRTSDMGVRALAVSAATRPSLSPAHCNGVMMSADSGKSWTRISDPNNLEMQGITSLAVDPKDRQHYLCRDVAPALENNGWREDLGVDSLRNDRRFGCVLDLRRPAQPSNVFASACSGIYASFNRGDSWRKLAGIPNTSRRTHVIREDLTQPNTIYAGTTTGLFKSANAGVNWKTVSNTQVNSIAFDPASAQEHVPCHGVRRSRARLTMEARPSSR